MAVASISREHLITGIKIVGAVSTVGGGVVAVVQAILGQDYTYPCTIMALGGWTWLTVSIGGCTQNEREKDKSSSKKVSFDQDSFNKRVDATAETGKKVLKAGASSLTDVAVSGGKAALVILSPGIGSVAGPLLDMAGESAKGISNESIDFSVDASAKGVKKSAKLSAKD